MPKGPNIWMQILKGSIGLLWGAIGIVVPALGLFFIFAVFSESNAIQQAAAGAVFSTIFIGMYVTARSSEKIVEDIDRSTSPNKGRAMVLGVTLALAFMSLIVFVMIVGSYSSKNQDRKLLDKRTEQLLR